MNRTIACAKIGGELPLFRPAAQQGVVMAVTALLHSSIVAGVAAITAGSLEWAMSAGDVVMIGKTALCA